MNIRRMVSAIFIFMVGSILPVAAAAPHYFPETQHNLVDPMATYWHDQGGLPVFGFPISEAFPERNADTGHTYATQYFERNRLEAHPEHQAPYHILLGLLGKEVLAMQGRSWETFPKAAPNAVHYFPQTGHAITHEPFWTYFRNHGLEFDGKQGFSQEESLALFGLPLSEATMETNSSGDTVLTQWFERARFEFHPNNPAEYQVLLGLLGKELTVNRLGENPFLPTVAQDESHAAGMQLFGIFNQRRQAEYNKPAVAYRAEVQADADQLAKDWTQVRMAGGDDGAVLDEANERLKHHGYGTKAVYLRMNTPLEAKCKGIDPAQPIAGGYSPVVASYDFVSLTLGVYGPYDGPCGRAITVVYVISY